jgi:hypothetical protein
LHGQSSLFVGISLLQYLLEGLNNSKLHGDLSSHSDQWEEHALIEAQDTFFSDGFLECMDVALVVLVGFGDDLDLDVLEWQHADHLAPARHTAAEEIFGYLERCSHLITCICKVVNLKAKIQQKYTKGERSLIGS